MTKVCIFFDGDVTYNATYNPFTLSSHYQSSDFEESFSYYTLNSDGTINTFNGIENGTMVYGNMISSGSEAAAKSVMMNNKHAKGLHKNFFKRVRK